MTDDMNGDILADPGIITTSKGLVAIQTSAGLVVPVAGVDPARPEGHSAIVYYLLRGVTEESGDAAQDVEPEIISETEARTLLAQAGYPGKEKQVYVNG